MTRMTLDATTAARFGAMSSDVELFDPSGNLVGYFTRQLPQPAVQEAAPEVYERVKSPYSDDELERIRQEPGESTLAEIWERLPLPDAADYLDDPQLYERLKPLITGEERDRRRKERGGSTTAEVLARLNQLP